VQVFVTCARCVVGNKEPVLAGALVGAVVPHVTHTRLVRIRYR
jgi:hypothetical protein